MLIDVWAIIVRLNFGAKERASSDRRRGQNVSVISETRNAIDFALANPGKESTRTLACYAALDQGPGHILRDQRPDLNWFVANARAEIDALLPRNGTRAIVDTTTLENALRLLDPLEPITQLDAGAVFDLSTFVSACLFDDHLLYLAHDSLPQERLSALIPGLSIHSVPWTEGTDFGLIVENTWGEAERATPNLFRRPEWTSEFIGHWTALVGEPVDAAAITWPSEYRRYFSSIDSIAVKQAVTGADGGDDRLINFADVSKAFIAESSIRAVFYSLLANAMDATYFACAFRTRLRDLICKGGSYSVEADTQVLLRHFNDAFTHDIATDTHVKPSVPMPFALSAVLAGAKTAEQLCQNIGRLRKVAAPLRSRRSDLTLAWRNRDQAAIRALVKAIGDDAAALAGHQSFMNHCLPATLILSQGGARPIFGALGHLLLSYYKLPDEVKDVLRRRCVRPELWALTQLSAQARRVLDCLPPIYDILKSKGVTRLGQDQDRHTAILNRLASAAEPA